MKELINIFVRRPVTVIMLIAAQITAAVFSIFNMPVTKLPDFAVPRVTVETVYSGMAANELRSLVTIPLEDGISPIKGLERIRSVSRDNRSLISLDFRWGTDPMAASVLVREAVDAVYPGLPQGVRKPAVTSGDCGNEPHAVIAVSSHNGNAVFARNLAEYELRSRLRKIDGVGSVVLVGGQIAEERISVDVPRLAAAGLDPSEFARILARETSDIPAGNARDGKMELVVTSSGRPESVSSLSRVIIPAGKGNIKVEDAGQLDFAAARRESVFVFNGKETAALEIYRRPGCDPVRLSADIKKVLDEAVSLFSRDALIELVCDSTPDLLNGIKNLLISAALGAAAVFTIILIFMRRLKYSLLAALSIPVSAAAGITALFLTGRSLNSMSLGGLAISIGLVSDISVIVLDMLNRAFKTRTMEPDPREAGDKAFSIASSSIGSTVTTALVFLPVIFLPGQLGSLFGDIAAALVVSVSAGWFYAQFCLPSLYLLFFESSFSANNKINAAIKNLKIFILIKKLFGKTGTVIIDGGLEKKYAGFLSKVLTRPGRVFIPAAALSAIGISVLLARPVVFINTDEAKEVWVSVFSPSGTLLENSVKTASEFSDAILGLPSIKTVYGRAGAEEEDAGRRADIDYTREETVLRCSLEKGAKPEKALAEIRSLFDNSAFPVSVYFPKDRTEVLLGLSSRNVFAIKGKDREELLERTRTASRWFENGAVPVNFRPKGQRPELRIYMNREAAAYLSIPAARIAETLYVINEGVIASQMEINGRPLDVRVKGADAVINGAASGDPAGHLEKIPILTNKGKMVYLGSLGKITRMEAEASLARLERSDVIYADIAEAKKIPVKIKNFTRQFPWFEGADESVFNRYRNALLIYAVLVLILLYMALGAQFESFLLPLIFMASIPFSLAGAGPALLIAGTKIDSGASLGLIALFGLVVNNSLVLYEISEEKILAGFSPQDAVYSGACERFNAILITTATAVFALLPLILSPQGNSQKSMSAAMLGGLAVSAALSLFAFPHVLIRYFKWKNNGSAK